MPQQISYPSQRASLLDRVRREAVTNHVRASVWDTRSAEYLRPAIAKIVRVNVTCSSGILKNQLVRFDTRRLYLLQKFCQLRIDSQKSDTPSFRLLPDPLVTVPILALSQSFADANLVPGEVHVLPAQPDRLTKPTARQKQEFDKGSSRRITLLESNNDRRRFILGKWLDNFLGSLTSFDLEPRIDKNQTLAFCPITATSEETQFFVVGRRGNLHLSEPGDISAGRVASFDNLAA